MICFLKNLKVISKVKKNYTLILKIPIGNSLVFCCNVFDKSKKIYPLGILNFGLKIIQRNFKTILDFFF